MYRFCESERWKAFLQNNKHSKRILQRYASLKKDSVTMSADFGKKYRAMIVNMAQDLHLCKCLCAVCPQNEHDVLANALFDIVTNIGGSHYILQLITLLVQDEFAQKHKFPTTILRVNSIVTKLMGKVTQVMGHVCLQAALSKQVAKIIDVYSNNLSGDTYLDTPEQLLAHCQEFFDSILSIADIVPFEIRYMCHLVAAECAKYNLGNENDMLSGLFMLRFVCPAIVLPHSNDICATAPSMFVTKKLTAIAKILQKLANGEKYSTQEHADVYNQFFESNRQKLQSYLHSFCQDAPSNPFAHIMQRAKNEDLYTKIFHLSHLQILHDAIFSHFAELITAIQADLSQGESLVGCTSELIAMIMELGPSSKANQNDKLKRKPSSSFFAHLKSEKHVSAELLEMQNGIITKSLEYMQEHHDKYDLSEYETANFCRTMGDEVNSDEMPVIIYMTMCNIKSELLTNFDKLLAYLVKHLYAIVTKHLYQVIIDFSFFDGNEEHVGKLCKAIMVLSTFATNLPSACLDKLVVLHPNPKASAVLQLLSQLCCAKHIQIHQVHNWSDLGDAKQMVPKLSQKCAPMVLMVKTSEHLHQGGQSRFLIIGYDSLLFYSSNSSMVRKQLSFKEMEHVRAVNEKCMVVKYMNSKQKVVSFYIRFEYECDMHQAFDKLHLAGAIYDTIEAKPLFCFSEKQTALSPQQDGYYMVAMDSVLIFKNYHFEKELALASIFAVHANESQVLIHYMDKMKTENYTFICESAEQFKKAVLMARSRLDWSTCNANQQHMDVLRKLLCSASEEYELHWKAIGSHVKQLYKTMTSKGMDIVFSKFGIEKTDTMVIFLQQALCEANSVSWEKLCHAYYGVIAS